MKVLFQNEHYVVVHKPAGWHVHPPESGDFPPPREKILLYQVRNRIGKRVYPVHRLDVGTCGVIVFGLNSEAANKLHQLLHIDTTQKEYIAVARGWIPEHGRIEMPLELDSTGDLAPAMTDFKKLAQVELPFAVGKKFPSARYSLLKAWPRTGKYHQIRRHFNRISHPLVGDAQHGDSHHNRFFREQLGIEGLCLIAAELTFTDPWTMENKKFSANFDDKWDQIFKLFNFQN